MPTKTIHLPQKIMTTDLYISLSSDTKNEYEMEVDINNCLNQLVDFEQSYSRFIDGNQLSKLNAATSLKISLELYDILEKSKFYYEKTNKIFDPTIHNALVKEGYAKSKSENFIDSSDNTTLETKVNFEDIEFLENNTIKKPINMKIDLGGIGKSYIVDKLTTQLKQKYTDFCISLGGDMYLSGVDKEKDYNYWAIEIENPFKVSKLDMPTLIVTDKAIATSGTHKRTWTKNNLVKTHIINPQTGESTTSDIVSATVIGDNTIYADIIAKVLIIKGSKNAIKYCLEEKIPAVLCTMDQSLFISESAYKYVWKE